MLVYPSNYRHSHAPSRPSRSDLRFLNEALILVYVLAHLHRHTARADQLNAHCYTAPDAYLCFEDQNVRPQPSHDHCNLHVGGDESHVSQQIRQLGLV